MAYIVQKAVELSKVLKKRQAVLAQPGYLDANYEAQHKYDGCAAVIVAGSKYREGAIWSRTGEAVRSMQHILDQVWGLGVVLLAEAWSPMLEFQQISGAFRKQSYDPERHLMAKVHDVLTYDEFDNGVSAVRYLERVGRVDYPAFQNMPDVSFAERYQPGSYNSGKLLKHLTETLTGYDGLIQRDPMGLWKVGSGTTGEIIKRKRLLSFDLQIIGVEEGKDANKGRLGAIVVDFKGKPLRVGIGFSNVCRESFWTAPPIGLTAEVEAMDYSSEGLLREPRFKGLRHDKLEWD